jgi:hypothetical protein
LQYRARKLSLRLVVRQKIEFHASHFDLAADPKSAFDANIGRKSRANPNYFLTL